MNSRIFILLLVNFSHEHFCSKQLICCPINIFYQLRKAAYGIHPPSLRHVFTIKSFRQKNNRRLIKGNQEADYFGRFILKQSRAFPQHHAKIYFLIMGPNPENKEVNFPLLYWFNCLFSAPRRLNFLRWFLSFPPHLWMRHQTNVINRLLILNYVGTMCMVICFVLSSSHRVIEGKKNDFLDQQWLEYGFPKA